MRGWQHNFSVSYEKIGEIWPPASPRIEDCAARPLRKSRPNDCLWRRPDAGQRVSPLIPDAIDPQRHWRANFAVTHNAALW